MISKLKNQHLLPRRRHCDQGTALDPLGVLNESGFSRHQNGSRVKPWSLRRRCGG